MRKKTYRSLFMTSICAVLLMTNTGCSSKEHYSENNNNDLQSYIEKNSSKSIKEDFSNSNSESYAQKEIEKKAETYDSSYLQIEKGTPVLRLEEFDGPSELQREFYNMILNHEPVIWNDNAQYSWDELYNNNPEDCLVVGMSTSKVTGKLEGDSTEKTYYITYIDYNNVSQSDYYTYLNQQERVAQDIIDSIPENADAWTKARYVHDWLVKNVTYDHTLNAEFCHSAYGALVKHNAVCSGYATAFKYVMGKMGIPVDVVLSETHAWNYFDLVNSDNRYIDVTWDDPDTVDKYGNPYILYEFFGLTEEEMGKYEDHKISGSHGVYDRSTINHDLLDYVNYFERNGYLFSTYNFDEVKNALLRQYMDNENLLQIKFSHYSAFEASKELEKNNCELLNEILDELGYFGYYSYSFNEDAKEFILYLNQPDQ